jgi:hypothetical protein
MPHNIHGATNGVDDGGEIFPFAFEPIRLGIPTVATPTPVHGIDAEVTLQRCQHRRPREMVAHGAMHE